MLRTIGLSLLHLATLSITLSITHSITLSATLLYSLSAEAEDNVLPVTEAFLYKVTSDDQNIYIDWDIQPGYYLYKSRMSYAVDDVNITLGSPTMRAGKIKQDKYFGRQEVFRDLLRVTVPFSNNVNHNQSDQVALEIRSQGCADAGLCYPPQQWTQTVSLQHSDATGGGQDASTTSNNNLLDILKSSTQFGGDDNFLPPEEAFRFSALMLDDTTLMVRWDIEDGYYLYRDKLELSLELSPELNIEQNAARLGSVVWPTGKRKYDEHFGDVDVFYHVAETQARIEGIDNIDGQLATGPLTIVADYQGCAEDGICYPPSRQTVAVDYSSAQGTPLSSIRQTGRATPSTGQPRIDTLAAGTKISEQDKLAGLIRDGSLPAVMATFFGLGLLLAFTPCVLPMVPILSGIIAGQKGTMTTAKSFTLSLVYVLAMALTYTLIGVIVAMLGKNVQAMFQNPFVLVGFSIVFVALALSMFDVWQFQMPVAIQNKLNQAGSGGGYVGVAIMGLLSALIVGPCVAAPLVAALIFIGQSGDAIRGGLTLFALAMGMGTPLLAYGASAGQLMLRAGPWMVVIKRLFGIMLLGVAIWLLARILPTKIIMLLWAALAALSAWALGLFDRNANKGFRIVAAATAVYAITLAISAITGGYDPIKLTRGTPWGEKEHHLEFTTIKTVAELNAAIASAAKQNKNTMLDFYADWCIECIKMEKETFNKLSVQEALGDTVLLQADVTKNDKPDQELLQYFGIYGPPTIAFFDRDGQERRNYRVVGFMGEQEFAAHARQAVEN